MNESNDRGDFSDFFLFYFLRNFEFLQLFDHEHHENFDPMYELQLQNLDIPMQIKGWG